MARANKFFSFVSWELMAAPILFSPILVNLSSVAARCSLDFDNSWANSQKKTLKYSTSMTIESLILWHGHC